jgi:glyoxylase-like metal-dependent hydrolase (beta-lactamase superfamily II)
MRNRSRSRLFAPLVVSDVVDPIPEGFVEAAPKLQYAFAPSPLADQTADLQQFKTFAFTFLGTGAMLPSRYRNVPGILIHCRSGFVALDVGEGFAGQLRRKFGMENTDFILRNLLCIWISHVHGDHHFGLYQLLQARAELCDGAVPLIYNSPIARHMELSGPLKFVHSPTRGFLRHRMSESLQSESRTARDPPAACVRPTAGSGSPTAATER